MNTARSVFDVLDPETYGMQGTRPFGTSIFPRHTWKPSRKLLIAGFVSIAALVLTSLFWYQAHAEFSTSGSMRGPVVDPSSGKIYLSAQAGAEASAIAVSKPKQMLELHIANNGLVLLEGAHVLSVSANRVRVEMKWVSESFTWIVNTNSKTKIVGSDGEKITLGNIHVGDTLTVRGMLTEYSQEPTIGAEFVRQE